MLLRAACPLLAGWCTEQCLGAATLRLGVDTVCGLLCSLPPASEAFPHTLKMMSRQHAAVCSSLSGDVVKLLKLRTCCNIPKNLEAAGGQTGVVNTRHALPTCVEPVLGYLWVHQSHACSYPAAGVSH